LLADRVAVGVKSVRHARRLVSAGGEDRSVRIYETQTRLLAPEPELARQLKKRKLARWHRADRGRRAAGAEDAGKKK
jgi:hypothetical protein